MSDEARKVCEFLQLQLDSHAVEIEKLCDKVKALQLRCNELSERQKTAHVANEAPLLAEIDDIVDEQCDCDSCDADWQQPYWQQPQ